MAWLQYLLLLACPLMMVFCMKGMFSGHKDKHTKTDDQQASAKELQDLQIKMADLMEQNQKLTKEIQFLKETKTPSVVIRKNA